MTKNTLSYNIHLDIMTKNQNQYGKTDINNKMQSKKRNNM
jgi:hypothetical protein